MRKFFLGLMVLFSSYIQATNFGLVPGANGNVTVIDTDSLSTIATIVTGENGSRFIAVSPDNKKAVVSNNTSQSITVIDLTSPAFPFTVLSVAAGSFPTGVAITPDSTKAFVLNGGIAPGTVSVIDLTANPPSILTTLTVSLAPSDPFDFNSQTIAITPNGSIAFVINNLDGTVTPIDIPTLQVLTPITITGGVLVVTCVDNTLALVTSDNSKVIPIDIPSLTSLTPISVGTNPSAIAIDSVNHIAYIANKNSDSVTPIDLTSLTALTDISLSAGSTPFFVAINDGKLFIVNNGHDSVTPVDITGPSPIVLSDITVGTGPNYCGFSEGKAFITNQVSSNVTPIDLITLSPLSNISVALNPHQIAFNNPPSITSPLNFSAKREVASGLFQKDLTNTLFWTVPSSGIPAYYKIFRDSALTDLVATLNGNITTFNDHARKYGVVYTYYLVAVDVNGNVSAPVFLSFP